MRLGGDKILAALVPVRITMREPGSGACAPAVNVENVVPFLGPAKRAEYLD